MFEDITWSLVPTLFIVAVFISIKEKRNGGGILSNYVSLTVCLIAVRDLVLYPDEPTWLYYLTLFIFISCGLIDLWRIVTVHLLKK